MRRTLPVAAPLMAGLVELLSAAPAVALVMAPPPPVPDRVARAECIVLARVVAVENAEVVALPYRGAPRKTTYRVAVLKISDALKGAKARQTLRLGFPAPPEPRGGGFSIRPSGPRFGTAFKAGQQGLFYLTRHFQEPFLVAPMYYDFVDEERPGFRQEVELARTALKLGNDLAAGLESADPRQRFYAAALLIQRYRTFRGGSGRTEPIDAKESRQILTVLAEADWEQPGQLTPWTLFVQLGLKAEDGWTFPATGRPAEEYHRAARAWLREHAATYRIRRIVGASP